MRLPHPLLLRLKPPALRLAPWLGWALLVAVLALSRVYEQTALNEEIWCLLRRETGLLCPGCGLTRAFCAMSRLDVVGALQVHLAGPSLYLTALYAVVWGAARLVVGPKMPSLWVRWPRVARWWWRVLIALFLVNLAKVTVYNLVEGLPWSTVERTFPWREDPHA